LIGLGGSGRKKFLATHCQQKRRKNMNQLKYSLRPLVVTLWLFIIGFSLIPLSIYASDNPNTITFENRSGEYTLVKLMGPTGQTVEVPHGESRTVNVAAGEYYLLVRYGSKPGTYEYTKGDAFTVTQTKTQYSVINITLHKVVGGNYPAHPISSEEFDNAPIVRRNVDRSDAIKTLTPVLPPPPIQFPPPTINIPPPTVNLPTPAIHLPPPTIHLPPPTIQLPPPTIQFPPPTINIPPPTVNLPLLSAQAQRTIKIEASTSLIDLIKTWDSNIWFFTPEDKPIRSLNELNREDIACWGMEHFQRMQELFKVLGIKGEGVKVKGDGAYNEATIKPKLYVTWAKFAQNLKGAQRVEFIEKRQRVDALKETAVSAPAQGTTQILRMIWSATDLSVILKDEIKAQVGTSSSTWKPEEGAVILEVHGKFTAKGSPATLEFEEIQVISSTVNELGKKTRVVERGPIGIDLQDERGACSVYFLPSKLLKGAVQIRNPVGRYKVEREKEGGPITITIGDGETPLCFIFAVPSKDVRSYNKLRFGGSEFQLPSLK
jgi:hypothetical protein